MRTSASPLLALVSAALALALCAPSAEATRVQLHFTRRDAPSCSRTAVVHREVKPPGVLRGAMAALLRGPTAAERARGYAGGWFSHRTAGMLRSVAIKRRVAHIDFKDLRKVIPNASASCGSTLLLAQLNRTALQFPTVDRAIYSINGSVRAFYRWLQRDVPRVADRNFTQP